MPNAKEPRRFVYVNGKPVLTPQGKMIEVNRESRIIGSAVQEGEPTNQTIIKSKPGHEPELYLNWDNQLVVTVEGILMGDINKFS